ncbi:MAG: hypothetical protein HYT69_02570 [Candidatus Zambryskibacteria bacterium]|nr:hypothetical protein [Candidatus Zambryskibacteria bacterium]
MKKRLSVLLAATAIFTGSIAYAETENINAALRELSELYDSPVVRVDQARAICNQEQYIIECAEIGKKYDLFPEEQEREVDALLTQFKGSVIEEFKQCVSTECLINVAARIAQELSTANPTLARTIDLTPEKVTEKRTIVDVAKTIGVDIDECRAMDPDTASVELLRACAKLAKHETVQRYIPEEYRVHVEKTENTAALKEALENGDIACGDGTLQGCGTFCLNPGTRTQGGGAIPPVCRQIAERFFGNEGIRELDSAYEHVRRTYDEAQIIYTEEYRNRLREGTTTPNTILCPAVINYSPCPPGQYRQESINEFGCFVRSACVPFNTRTLPKFEDNDRQVICPAMPTVSSCGINEERVAAYSSPECGTYYTCRPKVEDRSTKFPYTFRGGRVVVSFEEARIYCYESGFNGATARGDKGECLQTFHITVPEIPPEKQCAQYGTGWHSMDQSGNCFSESMTEYRTPGGILQQCSTAFIYGCTSNKDIIPVPFGQREQVWNSLGLRSWIRSDASESRISELKAACANVSSNSNIWLSGAGTQSSVDFGMPDTEKCRKATTCSSAQYWDGNGCVALTTTSTTTWSWTGYGTTTPGEYKGDATSCPGFAYSRWDKTGARYCQLNTQTSCQYFYPQYLTLGNYAPSSCPAEQSTGTVSGSCSTELINLLGSGCHSMSSAWFNSGMTSYVMPGGTTVRSCATEPISGCSGSNITTGTAQCADGRDNDNDGATDYPADSSCYDKTDNDEWYPSSGCYLIRRRIRGSCWFCRVFRWH